MIFVSCGTVKAVPSWFTAGTSGETPPTPPMPWHCAQANWEKSCAPAATVALTFDAGGVVDSPPVVVWVSVVVRAEVLWRPPSQAVTATAPMTRTIAATASPTALASVVPSWFRALDIALTVALCEVGHKWVFLRDRARRNYALRAGEPPPQKQPAPGCAAAVEAAVCDRRAERRPASTEGDRRNDGTGTEWNQVCNPR